MGDSIPPLRATVLVGLAEWMSAPFFLAGGLKVGYDVLLDGRFRAKSGRESN